MQFKGMKDYTAIKQENLSFQKNQCKTSKLSEEALSTTKGCVVDKTHTIHLI
jgi:hypothetical protein